MNDACFQLKGSAVSIIVLELYHYSVPSFTELLGDKVRQAPQFFQQSPVVISLEKFEEAQSLDFASLLEICREFHLQPMALRGVPEHLLASARECGLALIPANQRNSTELNTRQTEDQPDAQAEVVVKKIVEEKLVRRPSKVITRPVRSGQQVYSEGDLIVMSQVSAGAEVLAEGDIHIYGTLRGRALAGVTGDTDAKIFCQNLSAELIAIAGNFILSDSLQDKCWQEAAYISLEDENLQVRALS